MFYILCILIQTKLNIIALHARSNLHFDAYPILKSLLNPRPSRQLTATDLNKKLFGLLFRCQTIHNSLPLGYFRLEEGYYKPI